MLSVFSEKKEDSKELPLTCKVGTMQTEIQKCVDSYLDPAVFYLGLVSCQNRRPLRVTERNDFHFTIRSLSVLQNTVALDNTLYFVNSSNWVESFVEWEWIRIVQ